MLLIYITCLGSRSIDQGLREEVANVSLHESKFTRISFSSIVLREFLARIKDQSLRAEAVRCVLHELRLHLNLCT